VARDQSQHERPPECKRFKKRDEKERGKGKGGKERIFLSKSALTSTADAMAPAKYF
jgi:hypothetical protein